MCQKKDSLIFDNSFHTKVQNPYLISLSFRFKTCGTKHQILKMKCLKAVDFEDEVFAWWNGYDTSSMPSFNYLAS